MPRVWWLLGNFAAGCAILMSARAATRDLEPLDKPLVSPDRMLVVYAIPEGIANNAIGQQQAYGTKLYLRMARSNALGFPLGENGRWMAAQWSPNGNFRGVENHWDGHASFVDVWEMNLDNSRWRPPRLVFESTNGMDEKWFIEGWDEIHRTIHLRKDEVLHPLDAAGNKDFSSNPGERSTHHSFVIGSCALTPKWP